MNVPIGEMVPAAAVNILVDKDQKKKKRRRRYCKYKIGRDITKLT